MSDFQTAVLVKSFFLSTDVKSLSFKTDNFKGFIPGQYYKLYVATEDGREVEREYSIAGANKDTLEFAIKLIPNGEVSPFLHNLKIGEKIKVKGPFGKHFLLNTKNKSSSVLIAGGTGIVPFICMIRNGLTNAKLLVSFKTHSDSIYLDEVKQIQEKNTNIHLTVTYTREEANEVDNQSGRINREMIYKFLELNRAGNETIYVSGSTLFVEAILDILRKMNIPLKRIKTERFG